MFKDLIFIILNESDASIKHTIINLPNNDYPIIEFKLGIPIAGVHIDTADIRTEYFELVEIWYDELYKRYKITIRGLDPKASGNPIITYSEVRKLIVFYI